jgi:hypothetical protein
MNDNISEKMREMLDVQGQNGNWDYDPYMHGMYNGMEYMMAMVDGREPVFRQAPDMWLYQSLKIWKFIKSYEEKLISIEVEQ